MKYAARFLVLCLRKTSLRTVRAFGRIFGRLAYHLAIGRRKTALANLDLAYGETLPSQEKREIAKASFRNLMTTSFEFIYSPALHIDFENLVEMTDVDNFWKANQQGKGVLVIVPHMGNWELIGRFFRWGGVVAHAVSRRQKPEWMAELISDIREKNGLLEIDKRNALRPVMSALKRGETVCLLIDQHARKEAVETQFFGKPAMTVGSAALIALRLRCPVVVAASFRRADGGIGLVVSEPIDLIDTGDRDADILANTQRYVDVIERYVRLHPDCWMWMHRRWRDQGRYKHEED